MSMLFFQFITKYKKKISCISFFFAFLLLLFLINRNFRFFFNSFPFFPQNNSSNSSNDVSPPLQKTNDNQFETNDSNPHLKSTIVQTPAASSDTRPYCTQ